MVKRLFKRSLAIFLTVLMIATSLPLSAMAAELTAFSVDRTIRSDAQAIGLITNSEEMAAERINGNEYNIVNDNGEDNKFTALYWSYDISEFVDLVKAGHQINPGANFKFKIQKKAGDNCQGLSLYWAKNDEATTKLAEYNGSHIGTDANSPVNGLYTNKSGHRERLASSLDIDLTAEPIGKISADELKKITKETVYTYDVSSIINQAASEGRKQITFVLMQTNAATKSGSGIGKRGWSDTHVVTKVPNTIVCKYSETIDVQTGIEGLNEQIDLYEKKMSKASSSNIYVNMLDAYKAYQKAIKYRDAYYYGSTRPTDEEICQVSEQLADKTAHMIPWEDEITGRYEGQTPKFVTNDGELDVNENPFSDGSSSYSNIIYTEKCVGTIYNQDKDAKKDRSGVAVHFPAAGEGNVELDVYYPNTILLYDGVTPARMPVMFATKNYTTKSRYIYQVYPAQGTAPAEGKRAGNSPTFLCVSTFTGQTEDNWKGSNQTTNLDYNKNRSMSASEAFYPSGSIALTKETNPNDPTVHKSISEYIWYTIFNQNAWITYATSFQVSGKTLKAAQNGYFDVGQQWAWYGGSNDTVTETVDASLFGYKGTKELQKATDGIDAPKKRIIVINYKSLVDAIQGIDFSELANVKNHKQNGLASMMETIDKATKYASADYINGISTLDKTKSAMENAVTVGKEFKTVITALGKLSSTADTNTSSYDDLGSAVTTALRYHVGGNDNYYQQQAWEDFETAFTNATEYFQNNYDDAKAGNDTPIDASNTQALADALREAMANLKKNLINSVVDTDLLEHAIDNAEALIKYQNYFITGTIKIDEIQTLLDTIKNEIWQSVTDYKFDAKKIPAGEANQAKVNAYVQQLSNIILQAKINYDGKTGSGYSLNDAYALYQEKQNDNPEQWGNFASVTSAIQNAEIYKNSQSSLIATNENMVLNVVNGYDKIVGAIIDAINNLQKAFTTIKNGDIAVKGTTYKSSFASSTRPGRYKFYWNYTTDQIVFRTNFDQYTYTLPESNWGSYTNENHDDFETMIDSIILNPAADLETGEISVSGRKQGYGWPNPKNYGLTNDDGGQKLVKYAGKLTFRNDNADVLIDSIKCTEKNAKCKAYGVETDADSQGKEVLVNDINHDFVKELGTTEGIPGPTRGGIYAKNGWTKFDTRTKVKLDAQTCTKLTEKTTPSAYSYVIDNSNKQFGIVYFWRYSYASANWSGYSYESMPFNQKTSFINLAPLFELVKECGTDEFLNTQQQYTTASWTALQNAFANATTSNMDSNSDTLFKYWDMSYDAILKECDKRYTALYKARDSLKKCASNKELIAKVAEAKKIYDEERSIIEPASWAKFEEAYNAASAAVTSGGIYSAEKITDVDTDEQYKVDALTKALNDAIKSLVRRLSFADVDQAVTALIEKINSEGQNKFTKESVVDVQNAINALVYYNKTEEERNSTYDNNATAKQGLIDEAKKIPALFDKLSEGTESIDEEALNAAKSKLKADLSDPDAYDQTKVQDALNKLNAYSTVTLTDRNNKQTIIQCRTYATQTECDAAVSTSLSGVELKKYTVKGIEDGQTKYELQKPYGEVVKISSSTGEPVDWYYEMNSPSTTVKKKFLQTSSEIEFVVKGNTTLTAEKPSKTGTNFRVAYVNGVNSVTIDTDYVAENKEIKLTADMAPVLPYYTFKNFVVNGVSYNAGDTITVTKNTTITVNYDFSNEASYTVDVIYLQGMSTDNRIELNMQYNDEVSFIEGSKDAVNPDDPSAYFDDGYGGNIIKYSTKTFDKTKNKYVKNDIVTEQIGRQTYWYDGNGTDPQYYPYAHVYAWLEIAQDNKAEWIDKVKDIYAEDGLVKSNDDSTNYLFTEYAKTNLKGKAKVVMYGTDYTFRVHEDTILLPVTKDLYDQAVEFGLIDTASQNKDGVSVKTQSQLVISSGQKISIISTFAVPNENNYKLVERGILVTTKNTAFTDEEQRGLAKLLRLENSGADAGKGVMRTKSTVATAGNQYVISFDTTALKGKNIDAYGLAWVAYVTYRNADGKLVTMYTEPTIPTNQGAF